MRTDKNIKKDLKKMRKHYISKSRKGSCDDNFFFIAHDGSDSTRSFLMIFLGLMPHQTLEEYYGVDDVLQLI